MEVTEAQPVIKPNPWGTPNLPTATPWGKPQTSLPCSLEDVMSEQLATELQQTEIIVKKESEGYANVLI